MRSIKRILFSCIVLALVSTACASTVATISLSFTNTVGQPDTNAVKIVPVGLPILANGGFITRGPSILCYPTTNGIVTTNLSQGNYLATNLFLAQGFLFAVPSGTNSYTIGVNLFPISGFNTYNYTPGVRVITSTNSSVNVVMAPNGVADLSISNISVSLAATAIGAQFATNFVGVLSITNVPAATNSLFSGTATNAIAATSSLFSGTATNAITATNSLFSGTATNAITATNSLFSGTATNAITATNSLFSGTATNAITATNALFAATATNAISATNAMFASTATNAITATNSLFASTATNAITATNSLFASTATNAITATNSLFSSTATNAITATNGAPTGFASVTLTNSGTLQSSNGVVTALMTASNLASSLVFANLFPSSNLIVSAIAPTNGAAGKYVGWTPGGGVWTNAPTATLSGSTNLFYASPSGLAGNSGTLASPWDQATAIASAGANNTVVFLPGSYTNVVLSNPVTQSGLYLLSQTKIGAKVVGSPGFHGVTIGFSTISNVVVDGFEIVGAAFDGVNATGSQGITVRNCWIHNSGRGGVFGNGIQLQAATRYLIERNLIEYNGTNTDHDHGIYLSGTNGVIRDNVLRYNVAAGLQNYSDGSGSTGNQLCYGNLIYNNGTALGFAASVINYPAPGYTNFFFGNTIVATNRYAIGGPASGGPYGTLSASNNILVSPMSNGAVDPPNATTYAFGFNLTTNASSYIGPNSVTTNWAGLGFVNTGLGLYWINSVSAARALATPFAAGAVDFFGNVQNRVVDVGAFQFSSTQASDTRALDPTPSYGSDYWTPNYLGDVAVLAKNVIGSTGTTYASLATNAINAATATNSLYASTATNAITATNSLFSGTATNAITATNSLFSGTATNAITATNALFAATATNAISAVTATNSLFSSTATNAITATNSLFSGTATNANGLTTGSAGTNNSFFGDQYNTNGLFISNSGVKETNASGSVTLSGGNVLASGFISLGTAGIFPSGPLAINTATISTPGQNGVNMGGTFTASSGIQSGLSIIPTVQQSGSAAFSGIFVNNAYSSAGSGEQDLITLQKNGTAQFNVDSVGNVTNVGVTKSSSFIGNLSGNAASASTATTANSAGVSSTLVAGAVVTNIQFQIVGIGGNQSVDMFYPNGIEAFQITTNGSIALHSLNNNPVLVYGILGDNLSIGRNAGLSLFSDNSSTKIYDGGGNAKVTVATNVVTIATNTVVAGSLGYWRNVLSKTANYSVQVADSGATLNNNSAVNPVTNTLPAAWIGGTYRASVAVAQNFAIKAAGSDTIACIGVASAGGGLIFSSTPRASLDLECQTPGQWTVVGGGTNFWTFQ